MITLFRRIRQKLIDSGSVTKYLLYAIGEILLVVIGILIALQVNNWNEERILGTKEELYVSNLLRDLSLQIEEIDEQYKASEGASSNLRDVILHFNEEKRFKLDRELMSKISGLVDRRTFMVKNPTFTDMISSGNLGLIQSVDLRDNLVKYYQNLERIELIIQKNNDSKDNSVMLLGFTLTETIGPELFEAENGPAISMTFNNVDESELMLEEVDQILADKQNRLTLINLIRYRYTTLTSDMNLLNNVEEDTQALIDKLQNEF